MGGQTQGLADRRAEVILGLQRESTWLTGRKGRKTTKAPGKLRQKEGKEAGDQRFQSQFDYRGLTIYNNQGPYAPPSGIPGLCP